MREAEQAVLVDVSARLRMLRLARALVDVTRLAQETEIEKLRVSNQPVLAEGGAAQGGAARAGGGGRRGQSVSASAAGVLDRED